MNDLMVDIESMGKNTHSPIIAIAAVFFDPATGVIGEHFYSAVDIESELKIGAIPDGDTIKWWLNQSDEARKFIASDNLPAITNVLMELSDFIHDYCPQPEKLKLWGNGATFDNVILRSAYARSGLNPFWEWYNDLDVRTIVSLGRAIGFDPKRDLPFSGERHHALADAIHQANYVSAIYRKLLAPHKVAE